MDQFALFQEIYFIENQDIVCNSLFLLNENESNLKIREI
jgi:hypothetical protein